MNLIITGILTLITLSAFSSLFVMAEYSLVASRRTRLTEMAAMGRPGARIVLTAQADIERFLAGVQIGITVISIAIGILAEHHRYPRRRWSRSLHWWQCSRDHHYRCDTWKGDMGPSDRSGKA